jgi:Zn-dependent peptidase ImmA (M78 family)
MVFEGGHVPIYDMEKKCYTLIDVPEKTMMIDIRLLQDRRFANRLRFTYAHELAHFLIHKEHFAHSEQSPPLLAGEEEEYDDVIEKQANMFCSYFLIPTGQMKKVYNRLMAKGRSQNIVKEMAVIFGVAPATMQIRLYEHGLV